MCQQLIDDYGAGIWDEAVALGSRRSPDVCACKPEVLLLPDAQIRIGRISRRQRKTVSVGDAAPTVFVVKVQNYPADGILECDSLAGIAQVAGVLTAYIDDRAVSGADLCLGQPRHIQTPAIRYSGRQSRFHL